MREIKLMPLIVELIGSFFASSGDALERARNAKSTQVVLAEPTGLNIFVHRQAETQASLECIVFSFLTVEACINYLFFREHHGGSSNSLAAWLKQKWRRGGLSVYDRFVLLVDQYATARLSDLQTLCALFSEFISLRNLIVHAYPSEYRALVEEESGSEYSYVHDVEPLSSSGKFPVSGLSREIGRICLDDASRSFEVMLLMFSFLDEQFVADFKLPWEAQNTAETEAWRPRRILESLVPRHYPNAVVLKSPREQ
ncbi:MAG: hypothetical protein ABSF92_00285 [Candidatus Acidiferrales bacterium]|jgi:hypothetical protein